MQRTLRMATASADLDTAGSRSARLVLAGGHVIDPATGLDGRYDVAFEGGAVVAVAPRIDEDGDTRYVDDCVVVPGLIDLHAHVFTGVGESVDPDRDCLPRGTTTAVDGGSAGSRTFGAFRGVTRGMRTRVLAWLNLSSIGLADTRVGELVALAHMDVEEAVATARAHPELIVGFKARLSTYACGGACGPVLRLLREAADAADVPVMVHVGDTSEPLESIVAELRPGDVVTHALTGRRHGILAADGTLGRAAYLARERGVLLDAARGRSHLSFPVLEAAVRAGVLPDSISTDVTATTAADPVYGLPWLLTQLLAFGVSLEDALAAVTAGPARALRRADLGTLRVGASADAAVLRIADGPTTTVDVDGRDRRVDRRVVLSAVVRDGQYIPIAMGEGSVS